MKLRGNFTNLKNYLNGPLRFVHVVGQSLPLSLSLLLLLPPILSFFPFPSRTRLVRRPSLVVDRPTLAHREEELRKLTCRKSHRSSHNEYSGREHVTTEVPKLFGVISGDLAIGSPGSRHQTAGLKLLFTLMPRLPANVHVFQ